MVGLSSLELNQKITHTFHNKPLARSACKGFNGYPYETCISVNEVAVHGVPSSNVIIKEDDLVKVDICIEVNGYYSDACRTYCPSGKYNNYILANENLCKSAIMNIRPGLLTGTLGLRLQQNCPKGAVLLQSYCGHGIGKNLHEKPLIGNNVIPNTGSLLTYGMCFTVEPILVWGNSAKFKIDPDGWSVRCNHLTTQHEHTVFLHEHGCEILV